MDYEKKYKEALERMKYWMDENTPDEFFDKHEVHTFVFPELAESEDENIKEEIIHYLEITCNQMTPNQDWDWKNRWLPWLEKAGEREPKFRIGDTIKKKSTGDIVTVSEVDLKNREYRLSNTGFIPFKYEYLWELVEHKPAWSEEDESWFKEMELMCLYFSKDTDYRAEFSTWLKSLKDRYAWKLSDEQMKALKQAVDAEIVEVEDNNNSMYSYTHLEICTDEDLSKICKVGDKAKVIIIKQK